MIDHILKLRFILFVFEQLLLRGSIGQCAVAAAQGAEPVFIPSLKDIQSITGVVGFLQIVPKRIALIDGQLADHTAAIRHLSGCPVEADDKL